MNDSDVGSMVGETLVKIVGLEEGSDAVSFHTASGRMFWLFHDLDCCESVAIHDITGTPDDLLHSPLLVAREDTNYTTEDTPEHPESFSWTFYNFATVKGHVTLRWLGESNGFYSESVEFEEVR